MLIQYNIVQNFLSVILLYTAVARQKGRADEEKYVSSYWMALRKTEDDGT